MTRSLVASSVLTVAAMVVTPQAQPAAGPSRIIVRLNPALDRIISTDARLEVIKDDYFGFAEGPVWSPAGFLLFSDMGGNRVYKLTPNRELSVFLTRAGDTGSAQTVPNVVDNGRVSVAISGPAGLAVDNEGRLILCTHGDRALIRIEKDGTRTVLADRYNGKRLNGPNDVTVRRSDGAIYFTDRGSGLRGGETSPQRELAFNSIMRWKDGQLQVLDSGPEGSLANGLAFSPDETFLYTSRWVGQNPMPDGTGRIMRWDVKADGSIANPTLLIDTSADQTSDGFRGIPPDGIRVDRSGNIFTPGPGGVWIVASDGTLLGKIDRKSVV